MNTKLTLALLALGIIMSTTPALAQTSALASADAYLAIVKIKTFGETENGDLTQLLEGSGVIIKPGNVVLTNSHVITSIDAFDNSRRDVSYQICTTENVAREPTCAYKGILIAESRDLDVALLKIEPIPGIGTTVTFPYLSLSGEDATTISDDIAILGYPAIGGDTITITKGIISGKSEKYGFNWLKTDAIVSFGNSGGAAINKTGTVIGIATSAHADLLGSLGYIISANSIDPWVKSVINTAHTPSTLTLRLEEFTRVQMLLADTDTFQNKYPSFSITKLDEWEFLYSAEDQLYIQRSDVEEGGMLFVSFLKGPYRLDNASIVPAIRKIHNQTATISLITITKADPITLNGHQGLSITQSSLGAKQNFYFFPNREYLVMLSYDYGADGRDKTAIDSMVNSFKLVDDTSPIHENRTFSYKDPRLSLTAAEPWVILKKNTKDRPLEVWNKRRPHAYVSFQIEKANENTRGLNNDGYLSHIKQQTKELNQVGANLDYKVEILGTNAHFRLSNDLKDIVKVQMLERSVSTGEILVQDMDYFVRHGDYYININLSVYSADKALYAQALSEFNMLLQSLILGRAANKKLYQSLKGKIVLKVESSGEAYYIHPKKETLHFLGKPIDAFRVINTQGTGATNADLAKIPVGITNMSGKDSDSDGLPDAFENAIGTSEKSKDSDNDGFSDKTEIENGFNPNGSGRQKSDPAFRDKQKGHILLQVEKSGEAWYVNPVDGKRYFLGRAADAYSLMRKLGLGISNSNYDALADELTL